MAGKRFFVNGKLVAADELDAVTSPQTPKASKAAEGLDETPEKLAPKALEALISSRRFLAISLPSCPQCDELAAALASRGVPKDDVFVKWDKSAPEYSAQKAALSAFAGASFSFPQVFADGVYQGGFQEVVSKLDDGAYDDLLQDVFDAEPVTVKRWVQSRPMVVFSLPTCPQCDELKAALAAKGLPVEKIFLKLDKAWPQYQSLKAQLMRLIGLSSFSFPQSFVRSEYQGSFPEMSEKVAQGHLEDFFSEAFGIAPPPAPSEPTLPAAGAIAFDEDF